ncbi:hypothetical protein V6Z12_A01G168300 [Gossypium hirsutum]
MSYRFNFCKTFSLASPSSRGFILKYKKLSRQKEESQA